MRSTPKCEGCGAANGTGGGALVNDWGGGENAVASCPNCSLATAAAIWWDAWATPIWTSAPNPQVYPHVDDNRVSGVIGAGDNGKVLRGSGETNVEVRTLTGDGADGARRYEFYGGGLSRRQVEAFRAGTSPPPSPAPLRRVWRTIYMCIYHIRSLPSRPTIALR